ncbi:MAG: DUF6588 family protein [Gammaproteobacteria bacterium]|nr:DUF6588 family protein [Gammaproteobacteria bacterium]
MKFFRSAMTGVALLACSTSVSFADVLSDYLASYAKDAAQKKFDLLSEDASAAFSYKAITPAEPLSAGILPFGVDLGLEVSAVQAKNMDEVQNGLGLSDNLSFLPVPKMHAHIGIPFGIDFGAVYAPIPTTDIAYMGGEIRYSPFSGNVALPAIAIRGAYTTIQGIKEWTFNSKSVELTVSKGFLVFTPYAGIGNVWSTSEVKYTETATNTEFKLTSDPSQFKWFAGLNMNLGLMNLVGEVDQTGDVMTYSVKFGFRF